MRRLAKTTDGGPTRKRKAAALVAPPASTPTAPDPAPQIPEKLKAAHETHEWKLGLVGGRNVSKKDESTIKAWVDRKAVELLPDVIANLHFDLKFGTDRQRAEAQDRILDMNGLRKREAAAGSHATIVLNLGGGEEGLKASLPWLKRDDKK